MSFVPDYIQIESFGCYSKKFMRRTHKEEFMSSLLIRASGLNSAICFTSLGLPFYLIL